MKQFVVIAIFSLIFSINLSARDVSVPRQKIGLQGELLASAPKSISVRDLEALRTSESIKIFDPYNKNLETEFFGFYLNELVKTYAKADFKFLRVAAIDGYKIDIPKAEIISANLFLSYKDNKGYLTVDRMGPARIIAPAKGIINKDLLLKIGVYWVWQVKSFEFVK